MSFKGFKDKELKANEYVNFLKNLDRVRLDVEDKINQSADIMNTKARAREAMNAPVIKALGKTEADFAEIEKKLLEEQITTKISSVLKGTNAEIVDFFTNDYSKSTIDDGTGMQIVFDGADDSLITLGNGPYSRVAFNPNYTEITPYDISDDAIPVSRGFLLLLLLKLEDLKAYGALSGQSAEDIDNYLNLVQDTNAPDDVTGNEKFIELNDLFTQKTERSKKFKEKTTKNIASDLYDKNDPSNTDLERFFFTAAGQEFTEADVKETKKFLDTPVDSLDPLVLKILSNPSLTEFNKKYGLFELYPGYPDDMKKFIEFYFKDGEPDPLMPNDGNRYQILTARNVFKFNLKTSSPILNSGQGYIFTKEDFTDVFYRKKMGKAGRYVDQFDYMKRPDGSDVDPKKVTLTLLQVLIGVEGIEYLIRYISHFYATVILNEDKFIRDNPGDAGNKARERVINDLEIKFGKVNSLLNVNKGRREVNVINPNIEQDVYDKFVDLSRRLKQSSGGSIKKPIGGRMMSPEKFMELQAMKKIEASNPVNGGMINNKPPAKPKGRKASNGLYMMKDGLFGGLTIDMPNLFNNMKLKAMKGGSIAYENAADKDTIDLLTKRYDSRRAYSGLAQKNIAKLIQLSELPPAENSAKLKMTQKYITAKRARKGLKGGKIPEIDELIAMIGSLNSGNTPNKKLESQIFDLATKLVKSGDLDMDTYKQIITNYT